MKEEFSRLGEILHLQCKSRPVYYLANRGNWGDALIRYGTVKFFKDIKLNYREIKHNKRSKVIPCILGGTVIYGGGGAWCSLWNGAAKAVSSLSKRFTVIVLPSTFETSYTFRNTSFHVRDQFQSQANMEGANFCHDMAFYIGEDFYDGTKGNGNGYFFREDKESAGKVPLKKENQDLSPLGRQTSPVNNFFTAISNFSVIFTDRLHVAIAACLLKKEVHFYPGSYFKNYAVYLSSIKDHFPNVTFHENYE